MMLTHVGLFEGYGGTTMAAERALGPLRHLWVSDIKPAACTLLQHRYPGVPNLGDMTAIDYAGAREAFGQPDVLTASWPCQPFSSAGKRLGEADLRALWPFVADAIGALRPRVFLGENVARIATNGELRRVVRSLAALGYVGAWRVLRASDVDASHRRERCFVVAVDPTAVTDGRGLAQQSERNSRTVSGQHGEPGRDALRRGVRGQDRLTLLPTPCASNAGRGGTDSLAEQRAERQGRAKPTGKTLTVAVTLLPTPSASSYGTNQGGASGRTGPVRESLDTMARREHLTEWGNYAEAVARWGCAFDREAPAPTRVGPKGGLQLEPRFVEWMMGLPEGWVCDVPGLSRPQQLSMLGDGVVPQQGAAAFRFLLDHLAQRLAVAA